MSTKDDFDKIDTNKDGVISEEEYANAKKSSGIEKEKLNWFVRLITLGDRFDIKDFFDRFKKSIVEFIILSFWCNGFIWYRTTGRGVRQSFRWY